MDGLFGIYSASLWMENSRHLGLCPSYGAVPQYLRDRPWMAGDPYSNFSNLILFVSYFHALLTRGAAGCSGRTTQSA